MEEEEVDYTSSTISTPGGKYIIYTYVTIALKWLLNLQLKCHRQEWRALEEENKKGRLEVSQLAGYASFRLPLWDSAITGLHRYFRESPETCQIIVKSDAMREAAQV